MRFPLPMVFVMCVMTLLVDVYIFMQIHGDAGLRTTRSQRSSVAHYSRIKTRRKRSVVYAVVSLLFWVLLAYILFFPKRDGSENIIPVMWMIYGYLTVYLPKFIFCVFSLLGKGFSALCNRNNKIRRHQWKVGMNVFGVVVGASCFILMWYGAIIGRRQIDVEKVEIEFSNLPAGFDGLRIVQISDLHVGTWGDDPEFLKRIVEQINALHPDIVFFTGDIVNRLSSELDPFVEILGGIKSPGGIYSVLGNHDYGDYIDWKSPADRAADNKRLAELQARMGWKLLNNESVVLTHGSDRIMLIGVENWGDPPFKQYGDLRAAYPGNGRKGSLKDGEFKILLSHNPAHWHDEVREISNIDLTLSGHTHAMQARLKIGDFKWSPAVWRYKEWGGLYEDVRGGHQMRIYVNIGAGEVGMPFRIGADPEVTLIVLRKS